VRSSATTPLSLSAVACCLCACFSHTGAALRAQVDVTEIFRQIPHEKKVRMVSLLVYLVTFVVTIYKCASGPSSHFPRMCGTAACVVRSQG